MPTSCMWLRRNVVNSVPVTVQMSGGLDRGRCRAKFGPVCDRKADARRGIRSTPI